MNKYIFNILILALLLGTVSLYASSYALVKSENFFDARIGKYVDVAPGQIIVKFKPTVSFQSIGESISRHNIKIVKELPKKTKLLSAQNMGASPTVASLLDAYKKDPSVEYAEPNYVVHAFSTTPNDTSYSLQWALPQIKANLGWDLEKGSFDVVIAIIDTGISMSHDDLSGKIWNNAVENAAGKNNNATDDDSNGYIDDINGWDFINADSNPDDDNGHGTHVSGIAAAISNNSIGVSGVAWNCKLMAVKVLDYDGSGWVSNVLDGIVYAADNGAKVISISIGGDSLSLAENEAIQYAHNKGCVIVASAGNKGDTSISYPASFNNVISVGSVDKNDELSYFSNHNSYVDVVAPGGSNLGPLTNNIYSTWLSNSYQYKAGTSMSTPFVSGLAALLFSHNPTWTNSQVENQIFNTADHLGEPGRNDYYGYGRINVAKALDNTSPVLTLSSLTGGDYLAGGKSKNITWAATDEGLGVSSNGISIYYSTDEGSTFPNTIVSSIANTGSYAWTVPAIDSGSVKVRIVARDLIENTATAESTSNLLIDSTNPGINLTSLNGGQYLLSGNIENITWMATDENSGIPTGGISIYYSTDGGGIYPNLIAGAIANTGSYAWTTPTAESDLVKIRIIAQDRAGNIATAESLNNFNIRSVIPPSPLISPVISPTNVASVKLSGWKSQYSQFVLVNGSDDRVTYPSSASWECSVLLEEGANTFEVIAKDSQNNESLPSFITIIQKSLNYDDARTGASINLPIGSSQDTPIVSQEIVTNPDVLGIYPYARTIAGNAIKFISNVSNFTKPISITMKINSNSIHPSPYYWDDILNKWNNDGIVISSITASSITFSTKHFSVYAVFDVSGIISDIIVYPNPFIKGSSSGIIFDGLKGDETIRIYTIMGELITVHQGTGDIKWIWDLKNSYGSPVAQDVYLYLITNNLGQKKTGKLIVVN